MTSVESPLNAAHQHAANAEDYIAQGLLIPAAEEHYKAAEAFLACVEASSEENTKRTLRMLYNEHSKAGKELQRKIAKLKDENKDPSLPQKLPKAPSNTSRPSSIVAPMTSPSPPPTGRNNLSDSQQMVDESFLLLAQRSEGGDAFNQFWKITGGMLEHLSQPVAFAIAPLGPPENERASPKRRDTSSSSDTDIEDTISRTLSRGVGFVKAAGSKMLTRNDSYPPTSDSDNGRTFSPPRPATDATFDDDWDDDILSDEGNMADSYFLIPPSKAESSSLALKKENAALKAQLEEMQKQLETADRAIKQRKEQDQHLVDSILLARKEAQRAMTSSMMRQGQQPPADLAALTINTPAVPAAVAALNPPGRDREAQLLRRIRELEEDLRLSKVENEKQKAMIAKFRERWEKLKESAKRKKQARAAAEMTSVVNDRIDEDPEAEAQAERDDLQSQ